MTRDFFPEVNGLCACGHRAVDHYPTFRFGCLLVIDGISHSNPAHTDRNECFHPECVCLHYLAVSDGPVIENPFQDFLERSPI